jgi:hypothetical protein
MRAARKIKLVTPKPEATPAAIDNALLGQLAGICQAMGIIKLTSEALHELPAVDGTIASVAEALDGAYAILDGVLGHCETIEKQIRGEVVS